ncbi:hypothetical protein G5A68_04485 [Dorea formicigenerans]|nr:hypothetical protein [Dorea formicigenerans]
MGQWRLCPLKNGGRKEMLLFILYLILGYWATGKTIYANKVLISIKPGAVFFQKLAIGMFFGWILIPVAIVKSIFFK